MKELDTIDHFQVEIKPENPNLVHVSYESVLITQRVHVGLLKTFTFLHTFS